MRSSKWPNLVHKLLVPKLELGKPTGESIFFVSLIGSLLVTEVAHFLNIYREYFILLMAKL